MIRFVLKRHQADYVNESRFVTHETVDACVPELQALLLRGGTGINGHDFTEVVGAIICGPDPEVPMPAEPIPAAWSRGAFPSEETAYGADPPPGDGWKALYRRVDFQKWREAMRKLLR